MEAELVDELPQPDGWQYEPKWDGFRGVLENLGGGIRLWSRNARPLLRYFPELEEVGKLLPPEAARAGAEGEEVHALAGLARTEGGRALARAARAGGARRGRGQAARPAVPARLARRCGQGEAVQDRRLRDRRLPLERQGRGPDL